jgi:hypothetical protein
MLISNDITKQKYLIDSLTKDINKGKIFSLYLVSCYFTLISASYLIYGNDSKGNGKMGIELR